MSIAKRIKLLFATLVTFPSYMYIFVMGECDKARMDLKVWHRETRCPFKSFFLSYVFLMIEYTPFRNIMYYRIKEFKRGLAFHSWCLVPAQKDIYIDCDDIGGGFYISHGYGTTINAQKIGKNFHAFQGVTLGQKDGGIPTIGDNVTIYVGAKVIGKVIIGDNVEIGANAVVLEDVPSNHIAIGIPATSKLKKHVKNEEGVSVHNDIDL